VPSPEQGASSRIQSNCALNGSDVAASARTTRTDRAPEAATVRASRSTRFPRRSVATTRPRSWIPAASAVVLPPGAAHASRIRSPGLTSAISATSCDASSWTKKSPVPASGVRSGLPSVTTSASGAKRPAVVYTVRRERGGQLLRRGSQPVDAKGQMGRCVVELLPRFCRRKPVAVSQRPASHRGCASVVER
jgi:hypothetical protein